MVPHHQHPPVTMAPHNRVTPSPCHPATSRPSPRHPQELRSACFWRAVLAEALATLIFVGVVLGASAAPGPLAPALAGGLVAAALPHTLGAPQANPALTLALLCARKLSALRGAAGLLAQCTGAVLASAAARLALPDDASLVTRVSIPPSPVPIPVPVPVPAGAEAGLWPQVSAAGTAGQAWGWETFATFQLALAAFATADRPAGPAGLALGSAVAAGALAAVRTPPVCPHLNRGAPSPLPSPDPLLPGAVLGGQHEPSPLAGACHRHRHLGRPLGESVAPPGAVSHPPPPQDAAVGMGTPGCSVELHCPILPPGQGALLSPSAAPPDWVPLVPPAQDRSPPSPTLG